jgi:hypothetical protein
MRADQGDYVDGRHELVVLRIRRSRFGVVDFPDSANPSEGLHRKTKSPRRCDGAKQLIAGPCCDRGMSVGSFACCWSGMFVPI